MTSGESCGLFRADPGTPSALDQNISKGIVRLIYSRQVKDRPIGTQRPLIDRFVDPGNPVQEGSYFGSTPLPHIDPGS
jgi:hypothetical protein